jgi:hypothetical protein
MRQPDELPLSRQLPWMAAFGIAYGATSWIDMYLASGSTEQYVQALRILCMIAQPLTGLLLLKLG